MNSQVPLSTLNVLMPNLTVSKIRCKLVLPLPKDQVANKD